MRYLLVLLTSLVTVPLHAATLEGCHRPESDAFLAVACTNCKEAATGTVTAWCYLNPPTTPGGNGFLSTCFCSYAKTDLIMYVPPGSYAVAGATCDAGWRAVATRWQLDATSGGGDGGCDAPGPAPTPGVARKKRHKPVLHIGTCVVDASHHANCTWDQAGKP